LGVEELETLEGWARRPKTAQALAIADCPGMRERQSHTAVAGKLGVNYQTGGNGCWSGAWHLPDEPLPGVPRQAGDA